MVDIIYLQLMTSRKTTIYLGVMTQIFELFVRARIQATMFSPGFPPSFFASFLMGKTLNGSEQRMSLRGPSIHFLNANASILFGHVSLTRWAFSSDECLLTIHGAPATQPLESLPPAFLQSRNTPPHLNSTDFDDKGGTWGELYKPAVFSSLELFFGRRRLDRPVPPKRRSNVRTLSFDRFQHPPDLEQ